MEKKKTKTDKVAEAISLLAEAIKGLEAKIEAMKPQVTMSVPESTETITVSENVALTTGTGDFMPPQYRLIVDERLNQKFGCKIVYRTDGVFEFTVSVPKEYTNISSDKWKMNGGDNRLKVIENALGEIGVREWVDKIAENLGHDIMEKVHEDATKLAIV